MGSGHFVIAAKRILGLQLVMVFSVFSVTLALYGWLPARSALLGGMIAFLPNLYFACKIAFSKPSAAKQMVHQFYVGESTKLIITAALFYMVTQLPNVLALPVFCGFVAVLTVFWFALLSSENIGKGNNVD